MTSEFKSCLICKEGDVDPDNQYRMVLTNKTDWDHFIRQCKEKLDMMEINSLILALDGSYVKQLHDIPNHSIVWCSTKIPPKGEGHQKAEKKKKKLVIPRKEEVEIIVESQPLPIFLYDGHLEQHAILGGWMSDEAYEKYNHVPAGFFVSKINDESVESASYEEIILKIRDMLPPFTILFTRHITYTLRVGSGYSDDDCDEYDKEAGALEGREAAPLDIVLTEPPDDGYGYGGIISSWNETYSNMYPILLKGDVLVGIDGHDVKDIGFSRLKKKFNHCVLPVTMTIERSKKCFKEDLNSQHSRIEVRNKTFLSLVRNGQTHEVNKYLLSGQDVNITNEQGETAMHIAATHGYLDIVELLIKENGDPNLSTCNGYIPLHLAIINNRCEIIKYLAPLSNITIRDNLGRNLLDIAAAMSSTDTLLLITKLFQCNYLDRDSAWGWSAGHWAVYMGKLNNLKLLLDCGTPTYITSKLYNKYLWDLARDNNNEKMREYLIERYNEQHSHLIYENGKGGEIWIGDNQSALKEYVSSHNFTRIISLFDSTNDMTSISPYKYLSTFPSIDHKYCVLGNDNTIASFKILLKLLPELIWFIDEGMDLNKKILIHSRFGRCRSPSLLCCYLVIIKNFSCDDAIKTIQSKRFNIEINTNYLNGLKDVEDSTRRKELLEKSKQLRKFYLETITPLFISSEDN